MFSVFAAPSNSIQKEKKPIESITMQKNDILDDIQVDYLLITHTHTHTNFL